jgi:hypothetical protein
VTCEQEIAPVQADSSYSAYVKVICCRLQCQTLCSPLANPILAGEAVPDHEDWRFRFGNALLKPAIFSFWTFQGLSLKLQVLIHHSCYNHLHHRLFPVLLCISIEVNPATVVAVSELCEDSMFELEINVLALNESCS